MTPLRFEAWLKAQNYRLDSIGELARDFIYASKLAWQEKRIKIKVYQAIKNQKISRESLDAYHKATIEFREYYDHCKKIKEGEAECK